MTINLRGEVLLQRKNLSGDILEEIKESNSLTSYFMFGFGSLFLSTLKVGVGLVNWSSFEHCTLGIPVKAVGNPINTGYTTSFTTDPSYIQYSFRFLPLVTSTRTFNVIGIVYHNPFPTLRTSGTGVGAGNPDSNLGTSDTHLGFSTCPCYLRLNSILTQQTNEVIDIYYRVYTDMNLDAPLTELSELSIATGHRKLIYDMLFNRGNIQYNLCASYYPRDLPNNTLVPLRNVGTSLAFSSALGVENSIFNTLTFRKYFLLGNISLNNTNTTSGEIANAVTLDLFNSLTPTTYGFRRVKSKKDVTFLPESDSPYRNWFSHNQSSNLYFQDGNNLANSSWKPELSGEYSGERTLPLELRLLVESDGGYRVSSKRVVNNKRGTINSIGANWAFTVPISNQYYHPDRVDWLKDDWCFSWNNQGIVLFELNTGEITEIPCGFNIQRATSYLGKIYLNSTSTGLWVIENGILTNIQPTPCSVFYVNKYYGHIIAVFTDGIRTSYNNWASNLATTSLMTRISNNLMAITSITTDFSDSTLSSFITTTWDSSTGAGNYIWWNQTTLGVSDSSSAVLAATATLPIRVFNSSPQTVAINKVFRWISMSGSNPPNLTGSNYNGTLAVIAGNTLQQYINFIPDINRTVVIKPFDNNNRFVLNVSETHPTAATTITRTIDFRNVISGVTSNVMAGCWVITKSYILLGADSILVNMTYPPTSGDVLELEKRSTDIYGWDGVNWVLNNSSGKPVHTDWQPLPVEDVELRWVDLSSNNVPVALVPGQWYNTLLTDGRVEDGFHSAITGSIELNFRPSELMYYTSQDGVTVPADRVITLPRAPGGLTPDSAWLMVNPYNSTISKLSVDGTPYTVNYTIAEPNPGSVSIEPIAGKVKFHANDIGKVVTGEILYLKQIAENELNDEPQTVLSWNSINNTTALSGTTLSTTTVRPGRARSLSMSGTHSLSSYLESYIWGWNDFTVQFSFRINVNPSATKILDSQTATNQFTVQLTAARALNLTLTLWGLVSPTINMSTADGAIQNNTWYWVSINRRKDRLYCHFYPGTGTKANLVGITTLIDPVNLDVNNSGIIYSLILGGGSNVFLDDIKFIKYVSLHPPDAEIDFNP